MGSKAEDLAGASALRGRSQSCVMRVVAVENRDAAGLEPEEDLGLGIGNRLDRREEAEMHRLHRRDHRDMRAHEPREVGDLAGMVHAELEDAVAGVRRQAGERQRRAPMIVEPAGRGIGRAGAGERQAQRLLRPGLADAAGYRDDPGCAAVAPRRAERGETGQGIGDAEQRRCRRKLRDFAGPPLPRRHPAAARSRQNRGRRGWGRAERRTGRPAARLRVSIETPVAAHSVRLDPPVAAAASAAVHSAVISRLADGMMAGRRPRIHARSRHRRRDTSRCR